MAGPNNPETGILSCGGGRAEAAGTSGRPFHLHDARTAWRITEPSRAASRLLAAFGLIQPSVDEPFLWAVMHVPLSFKAALCNCYARSHASPVVILDRHGIPCKSVENGSSFIIGMSFHTHMAIKDRVATITATMPPRSSNTRSGSRVMTLPTTSFRRGGLPIASSVPASLGNGYKL